MTFFFFSFNFYYNHKSSDGKSKLQLVNWWTKKDRLFQHPLLPPTEKVYQNFKRRVFRIPVVHVSIEIVFFINEILLLNNVLIKGAE